MTAAAVAVPMTPVTRRLEYTWAFDAWAAAAWGRAHPPVVLALAPVFAREAVERLPDVRVLGTTPAADPVAADVAASTGPWGSALWAAPGADWTPTLRLAADRLAPGAPLFVLATARLGWLLRPLRAGLQDAEAGVAVLRLGPRQAELEDAGFAVRGVTGLRSAASLAASLLVHGSRRLGRADLADRWEQRARQQFIATGPQALWSVMVLIEVVRR